MQPSIRRLILSAPEVPRQDRPDSVFYQLQVMPLDSLTVGYNPSPRGDVGDMLCTAVLLPVMCCSLLPC